MFSFSLNRCPVLTCFLVLSCTTYLVADPALSCLWDVEIVAERDSEHECFKEGQDKQENLSPEGQCSAKVWCEGEVHSGSLHYNLLLDFASAAREFHLSRGPPSQLG
jgi:hypothetical protein